MVNKLICILIFFPAYLFCQDKEQVTVIADMRETYIQQDKQWGDCVVDSSIFNRISYGITEDNDFLAPNYLHRFVDHKACPDTILRSTNGQEEVSILSILTNEDFNALRIASTRNIDVETTKGRAFINNNFHIRVELGSEDGLIILDRHAEEGDYVRSWYNETNGERIVNPAIDSILYHKLPDSFFGSQEMLVVPMDYDSNLHLQELENLVRKMVATITSGDSVRISNFIQEIVIDEETIEYMIENEITYRSIPKMLISNQEMTSSDFIAEMRHQLAGEIESFTKRHSGQLSELAILDEKIRVAYFNERIMPIEQVEMAEVIIKVGINDKQFDWNIGEMLRMNGRWTLFSEVRL